MACCPTVGAWGSGPFDNDDAADFLGDLSEIPPSGAAIAMLGDALLAVIAAEDYLEAPEMSRGIAAAATVSVLGNPELPSPSQLDPDWISAAGPLVNGQLRDTARHALDRAFEPEANEWLELWTEAGLVREIREGLVPYRASLG